MTPFAQLEHFEKVAAAIPNPHSGLVNPYAGQSYQPTQPAAAAGPQKQWGVIDNMWGDIGVSSIPIAGSVYMGNRAIQDFRQGRWGAGIGNTIWAGLGLIPGAGAVKGALGAIKGGVKGLSGAKAVATAAGKGAMTTGPLGTKGMLGASAAGMVAPMADGAPAPEPRIAAPYNAHQPAYNPLVDLRRTMVNSVVNNGR